MKDIEEDRLIDVSLSRNYNNSEKKENEQKAWIKLLNKYTEVKKDE